MQEETLERPVNEHKVLINAILIANPTAGNYIHNKQQLEETLSFLRNHHWQVELQLTRAVGDARRLAREAVQQHLDAVVAVGGDGTINEVIQELAGSETALGVLPSGTVNVWAREIGIPLENRGARDVLVHGQIRRIDLGYTPGHYFILMTGIGIDGEVTLAVEKKPVKRFGVFGYALIATWFGLNYPSFRAFLQIDGRVVKVNALQIIIGNTQLYGGALKYTWRARCDDGLLDICIVKKQTMLGRILIVLDLLLQREKRQRWIRYEVGTNVKIRTHRQVATQIDGDPHGYIHSGYPATSFMIVPHALKVIVPQTLPQGLFSQSVSIE